ncbi:MAG: hypothetical protein APF81_08080 [Desulfosporosinus sp. BRH_c37]|nr:MAG: hypothetical protein APF81_08080 [Desulfosporosinus sp. BRH_c37]
MIEENTVINDEFEILRKLTLGEYFKIRGLKKQTIIFNSQTRVTDYHFNRGNMYLVNNIRGIRQLLTKDEQIKLFRSFSNGDFETANMLVELTGSFECSNIEYITNVPYIIHFIDITKSVGIEFPKSVIEVIRDFLLGKRNYGVSINHEIVKTDEGTFVFYEYDEIFQKYIEKKLKRKRLYEVTLNREKERQRRLRETKLIKGKELLLIESTELDNDIYTLLDNTENLRISMIQPQDKSHESTINNYTTPNNSISNRGSLEPEKKLRSVIATSRNLSIVKFLKNLYKDKCQICGETIEVSPNSFMSEVHHIKPLGVYNGPDVTENAIVLCPNHHTMFDRGAITIDIDQKIVIHFNPENPLNNKHIDLKHKINGSYIDFHNQNIFINSAEYQNREEMIFAKDEIAVTVQTVDFGNIVTLQDMDTSELFDIKLEDKFNKDFMKPIEKVILRKCLNDIVRYDAFRYKVIDICIQ